jgi:hypothetical protein
MAHLGGRTRELKADVVRLHALAAAAAPAGCDPAGRTDEHAERTGLEAGETLCNEQHPPPTCWSVRAVADFRSRAGVEPTSGRRPQYSASRTAEVPYAARRTRHRLPPSIA